MDFIDRNVRVGFDTAEEHDGHTILHVKGKSKTGIRTFVPVLVGGKRYQFELTKTMNLLRNISYSNKIEYYYSGLTKAEVYRALRKTHFHRASSDIIEWWKSLRFLLNDYRKVDIDFSFDEELLNLALRFPVRKNVQDYIHLIISKKKNLAFITSDKLDNQIKELQKSYYEHIYYWPEIKDKIPLNEEFKQLSM